MSAVMIVVDNRSYSGELIPEALSLLLHRIRAGRLQSNGSETAHWSFTTRGAPGAFDKVGPADGATGQATSLSLSWGASSDVVAYEYCHFVDYGWDVHAGYS